MSLLRFRTWHDWIVSAGLIVVIGYLISRCVDILHNTWQGSSGMLIIGAIALGVQQLWNDRHHLAKLTATPEDQFLGYLLILSGIGLLPFNWSNPWIQALLCGLIWLGMICSRWGLSFFSRYSLPAALIAIGFIPQPTVVFQILWQTLTPPEFLERGMAWAATWGLTLIGQSATLKGTSILLPEGAVNVAYGCNGTYIALTMLVTSLLLGLWKQQPPLVIAKMVAIGVGLALVTNIPRIMLMTLASVYWGKEWFDFWHSSWGGQIFITLIFTVHYYWVSNFMVTDEAVEDEVRSPQA
ncbi:MAG: hypothetical protein Kow00121_24040 [Elainellaceae cyanobacterium]